MIRYMRWNRAYNLTSISSVFAVFLLIAAHGGILPRAAATDPGDTELQLPSEPADDGQDPDGDGKTSAPLELLDSLPDAMLVRFYTQESGDSAGFRTAHVPRFKARGQLRPTYGNAADSTALAGAYRLLSLRRDAHLALPIVDPLARTRAARDPAITSSISILGPPLA